MRGRPKRQSNDALIALLQSARRQAGVSSARIAELAGVSPSTVARSIRCGAFSEDFAARITALLERGIPESKQRRRPALTRNNPPDPASDSLHILHKLFNLMPELQIALKTIFGEPASRGQGGMHD